MIGIKPTIGGVAEAAACADKQHSRKRKDDAWATTPSPPVSRDSAHGPTTSPTATSWKPS
jgi:hypothetical protein